MSDSLCWTGLTARAARHRVVVEAAVVPDSAVRGLLRRWPWIRLGYILSSTPLTCRIYIAPRVLVFGRVRR